MEDVDDDDVPLQIFWPGRALGPLSRQLILLVSLFRLEMSSSRFNHTLGNSILSQNTLKK